MGALLVALALALLVAACGSGGGKKAANSAATGTQTISFQKPEDAGPQPFTGPADISGGKTVAVQASGPYGGTGSNKVCDRDLLIRFLKQNPDRMREWARVEGIDPSFTTVARYIAKLHPVTLTRDTQVTNHSFVNGRAVPFQSILQAGTAVLVDKYGRPVARCRCGNPLKEPIYFRSTTCRGCPPNYAPPPQCKLYSGQTDYDNDTYTASYYSNNEYDKAFIDWAKNSPYSKCYEAYPDPPGVTVLTLYKVPAQQTQTSPTYTTPQYHRGIDCNNPRSQYEYEQCHPPSTGGYTNTQPDHNYPPGSSGSPPGSSGTPPGSGSGHP